MEPQATYFDNVHLILRVVANEIPDFLARLDVPELHTKALAARDNRISEVVPLTH